MSIRQVIRLIEAGGWRMVRRKGRHRQYKDPTKSGRVGIAGNLGDDLAPKTLASVLR